MPKNRLNIKNIIWDWNGTLLDDRALCMSILNRMLTERGLPRVEEERYLDIFTFPVIEYYRSAGFTFEEESYEIKAQEFMRLYDEGVKSASLVSGTREALLLLQEAGITQYILSATRQEELFQQVRKSGTEDFFAGIYGTGTILAYGKAETARRWAEEHREELENTLFIGDTPHDAEVAELMGVETLLLSCGHVAEKRLLKTGKKVYHGPLEAAESCLFGEKG